MGFKGKFRSRYWQIGPEMHFSYDPNGYLGTSGQNQKDWENVSINIIILNSILNKTLICTHIYIHKMLTSCTSHHIVGTMPLNLLQWNQQPAAMLYFTTRGCSDPIDIHFTHYKHSSSPSETFYIIHNRAKCQSN